MGTPAHASQQQQQPPCHSSGPASAASTPRGGGGGGVVASAGASPSAKVAPLGIGVLGATEDSDSYGVRERGEMVGDAQYTRNRS